MFDFVLQGWFSDRVSTAIKESNSVAVAEAYLIEHQDTIANRRRWTWRKVLNHEGVALLISQPQRFQQPARPAWHGAVR